MATTDARIVDIGPKPQSFDIEHATPMQLYAIYAPAHHTPGKVQPTAAVARADEEDAQADWSVQPAQATDKHG